MLQADKEEKMPQSLNFFSGSYLTFKNIYRKKQVLSAVKSMLSLRHCRSKDSH
jgi:hypothetical protein